jgi:hypothetical protein
MKSLDFVHRQLLKTKIKTTFWGQYRYPKSIFCFNHGKRRNIRRFDASKHNKSDTLLLETCTTTSERNLLVRKFWIHSVCWTSCGVGSQGPVFVGDGWEEVRVRGGEVWQRCPTQQHIHQNGELGPSAMRFLI